jgi:NAD(P)H-flavin reductase
VSWSAGKQKHLDLLVKPRKGITRKLFGLAKTDNEQRLRGEEVGEYIYTRNLQPHLAFISGPHGLSVPVSKFKTVVMIASGFGIASQLPYLRQLYYSCKTRNRRIHLVWEPETEGKSQPALYLLTRANTGAADVVATMPLLNSALIEDSLDNGYVDFLSFQSTNSTY